MGHPFHIFINDLGFCNFMHYNPYCFIDDYQVSVFDISSR